MEKHTVELSEADKKRMQEESSSLCGAGTNTCETIYDVLLGDVSPNGQYGLYYDTTNNEVAPGVFPLSVMNHKNNKLPFKNADWRHPDPKYKNRDGSTSYVKINRLKSKSTVLLNQIAISFRQGNSVVKPQNILKLWRIL
ncbi:MAG: hypothetical protein U5L09_15105 [Bacteroidales bacterium]|nr:hypothetical protein [Bacteroidales bacterium]